MVATWKKDKVKSLADKIKSGKVVGVVSISGVPSKQMQAMRKSLKGQAEIVVSRGNILKKALGKGKIEGMDEYFEGPSGIIFTDLNPFELEKLLYSKRESAPAKAGSKAPFDLIVPKGDTGLPAGPVIGDLQAAGVKAKIQGGKIEVTEESVVAKEGERIDEKTATVLARLGVEPMEIVLKLKAAYEDGIVYSGEVLHIDEQETLAKLQSAYQGAFNLAYNARVYNKDVMEFLVVEAITKARNLMLNAEILNKETVGLYLARADAQAKALKAALPEELKPKDEEDEAAEEPKKEGELPKEDAPREADAAENPEKGETPNEEAPDSKEAASDGG